MAKISIILPTRGRQSSVYRLLDSIVKTTDNPEDLEIIIYADEDDIESQNISFPAFSIIKLTGQRETMGRITNLCYKASTGSYIFLMNDDVVFRTSHWDTVIFKKIKSVPDEVFLIYGNDLHKGEKMPSFPIISRKFCELMDGACPDNISFHIEGHIFDIFKRLKRFGFNRIVYLSDIIFEHLHYLAGKSSPDDTYLSRNNQMDEITFISISRERYYLALKLAWYIKGKFI